LCAKARSAKWLFVVSGDGKATHILNFRKFEPLLWTRVSDE